MPDETKIELRKVSDLIWEIPKTGGMRVPGRIFCSERLFESIKADKSPEQVANVAHLPGIVSYSLAMPDMHWGYGFPIGGVAATDIAEGGVVSPGGVGYDINCGIRLATTDLKLADVKDKIETMVHALFANVPCGVGSTGGIGKLSQAEEKKMLVKGAEWVVENGFGKAEDMERTEEGGRLRGADPEAVSERALKRGSDEVGTLGSGNHFLELDVVDTIYDAQAAAAFGLAEGQLVLQIHSGSRGLGHQVCDDYIRIMNQAAQKYGIHVPDRELCCAPVNSPEAQRYLAAMACAANYAWANRQAMLHLAEQALLRVLKASPKALGMRQVYDVCHNIAKLEDHTVGGQTKKLCVHRKGATRAFPPGHPDVPAAYRAIGQPVLIPGDMGRCSYVLVGTQKAMEESWGTTCHGAGRTLSRTQAIKQGRGRNIQKEMAAKGIFVRSKGRETLAEEMSEAYKDVSDVVEVMHQLGITRKVARLRPVGVMKG
ncbi:MAG: RtcB family protein [Planctomycetes bacterium]|nr:RtcB family protein [Planctomycetota bacterium]